MHVLRIHKAIQLNTYIRQQFYIITACPFLLEKNLSAVILCLRFCMYERVRLVLVFNTLDVVFHKNTTGNAHVTQ